MQIEHTVTLVADIDLDKMSDSQRKILESWTDEQCNLFISSLSIEVLGKVLETVNENGSWAFLKIK